MVRPIQLNFTRLKIHPVNLQCLLDSLSGLRLRLQMHQTLSIPTEKSLQKLKIHVFYFEKVSRLLSDSTTPTSVESFFLKILGLLSQDILLPGSIRECVCV